MLKKCAFNHKKHAYYAKEYFTIMLEKCSYYTQEMCLLRSRNVPITLKKGAYMYYVQEICL